MTIHKKWLSASISKRAKRTQLRRAACTASDADDYTFVASLLDACSFEKVLVSLINKCHLLLLPRRIQLEYGERRDLNRITRCFQG